MDSQETDSLIINSFNEIEIHEHIRLTLMYRPGTPNITLLPEEQDNPTEFCYNIQDKKLILKRNPEDNKPLGLIMLIPTKTLSLQKISLQGINNMISVHPGVTLTGNLTLEIKNPVNFMQSNINLGNLRTNNLNVLVEGSGYIHLGGQTETQDVKIKGNTAGYNAKFLKSSSCDINIEGDSTAIVSVIDRISQTINGDGNVTVLGNPGQQNINEISGPGNHFQQNNQLDSVQISGFDPAQLLASFGISQ